MLFMSCVCHALPLSVACDHLKGKGWPLGSCLGIKICSVLYSPTVYDNVLPV